MGFRSHRVPVSDAEVSNSGPTLRTRIVAVGRVKEPYLRAGLAEYSKRLRAYTRFDMVETKEEAYRERASTADRSQLLTREGDALQRAVGGDYVVALAIDGKAVSSLEFAAWLQSHQERGAAPVAFVIGGSLGLSDAVRGRAAWRLSLGPMTLPHQLARLILAEQLYRAFTILRGEPYHK